MPDRLIFAGPRPAPLVEIETTDRGVDNGPVFYATKCVEAMEIRGDEIGFPDHVKAQLRRVRAKVRDIIVHHMRRALNNQIYHLEIRLRAMGHTEAADYLKTERLTQ